MTILFSPIGTADPLTQLGDGPMLHIVRHRAPDKVVLFLSPAMAEHQRSDARYTKAIDMLVASTGQRRPELMLIESTFQDVHRFDHYIEEFERELLGLAEEAGNEAILANVSSGTPGMEQALVALGAFGRLNLELLQVATPKKGVNSRHDREDPHNYDLDVLWELNPDEQEGSEARLRRVQSPNFADRLLRGNVIALVRQYEYEAAYILASQMRDANPGAIDMIRAAADRLNLDAQMPAKVFGGTELAFKSNDLMLEHIYVMEVRLRQGHWGEFLRLLTPVLTQIMKRALRPYLPEGRYLLAENGIYTERYDWLKIEQDERLRGVLQRKMRDGSVFVNNDTFMVLMREYCEDDHVLSMVEKLRRMENKCRNPLAHTITSSAKRRLEKEGGSSLEEIFAYVVELHGGVRQGLYDRVSEAIVRKL